MIYKYIKSLLFVTLLTTSLWGNGQDGDSFGPLDEDLIACLIEYEKENGLTSDLRLVNLEPFDLALAFIPFPLPKPLWISTKKPIGRDLLYSFPQKIMVDGGITTSLFLNVTDRMPVSVNSLFGNSLEEKFVKDDDGNLTPVGFIPLLRMLLDGATGDLEDVANPETLSRDIVTMLPLLRNITIQAYKTGLWWQGGMALGPFMLQLQTSLQVAIRNFWLGSQDREDVAQIMAQHFQGSDFDYSELYQIRAGLGDTRFKVGLNTVNMTNFKLDVGGELILPTSLFAGDPRLKTDTDLVVEPDPIPREEFVSNMTTVLQGIRDYLLAPQLGNAGHFGTGIYLESKVDLFHELAQLWMRVSYDYLFTAEEDRLFLFKTTRTTQDLENLSGDEDRRPETALVVNEYLQQYLFPSSFRCDVLPGGVFNAIISVSTTMNRWRFGMGYDFYAKKPERIRRLKNTSVSMNDLDISKGIADKSMHQHKIFSESLYTISSKKTYMAVGWGSDFTLASRNIGSDWTFYLKFVASF